MQCKSGMPPTLPTLAPAASMHAPLAADALLAVVEQLDKVHARLLLGRERLLITSLLSERRRLVCRRGSHAAGREEPGAGVQGRWC